MTFEDAVWIGLGIHIDADNRVTVPHDCDEDCHACPRCYRASGAEVCARVCRHATEHRHDS